MTASAAVEQARELGVSESQQDEWNAFVDSRDDATFYHRFEWRRVFERAFGHECRYLAASDRGTLVGVLPIVVFRSRLFGRFAVSLPFVNYGGVLAGDCEAADRLLAAAVDVTRTAGGRFVELRHTTRHFPGLVDREHKVAMRLPLGANDETQWQALDRKVRNLVRKAEKSHLESRIGGSELLEAFYDVFSQNMRDLGTPVYSPRFFAEVLGAFPDRSRVLTVWHDGRPVAASIVLWHRGTMEVPWASSLREASRLAPNMLLYWNMLRFAIASGCHTFDFGRSTPDEGTFEFKRQWGAEPVQLHWEYWLERGARVPDLSPKNPRYDRAIRAWQRLPVGLTRWLGPLIVRNIP